jgi:hypothetical protein
VGLTGQKIALHGSQFEIATLVALLIYSSIVIAVWRLAHLHSQPQTQSQQLRNMYEN